MTDKTLTCRDCGMSFVFTAGEQEFFASRGLMNAPSRCTSCRATRKERVGSSSGGSYSGGGGYSSGGGYERRERQMHQAVCAQCGKDTQVPFEPRGDRPVYCSDCYSAVRGTASSSRSGRSRW